jgi:hypothetical protein
MSFVTILASVIYSYCHYSSLNEWKIIFRFLEAKVVGLFTSQNKIIYILNNLLIDKVLLKFKHIGYEGLKLAGILNLIIFGSMLFCLWIRQKIVNDNPYPKLPEPKIEPSPKISVPVNQTEFLPTEEPDQFIKVKNI